MGELLFTQLVSKWGWALLGDWIRDFIRPNLSAVLSYSWMTTAVPSSIRIKGSFLLRNMLFNLVGTCNAQHSNCSSILFHCALVPGVRLFWKLWVACEHTKAEAILARLLNKGILELYKLMHWLCWNGSGLIHWPFSPSSLAIYKLLFVLLDNSTKTDM